MRTSKSRSLVATLALAAAIAVPFAMIGSAEAKSSKCTLVPVAGQPGTFIAVCSTHRP